MRGALRFVAGIGVLGAVACTSILGDFTATEAPGKAQPDATAPGSIADSGSRSDAGDASPTDDGSTDAGAQQLSCSTWLWNQPLVVEDLALAPSPTFSGKFTVFPGDTGQVRIVAGKSGTPTFSVYTVTKSSMQVQQLDAPGVDGGNLPFVSVVRHVSAAQGGTTAIVVGQRSPSPMGATTSYTVTTLNDLMPATGPLPAPFPFLSQVTSAQTVDDLDVLPFSTTDVFEAASLGTGNPPVYTLGVARISPTSPAVTPSTLAPIATSPNEADFNAIRLLHTNSNVYVYNLNDLSTPGTSGWTVPDTAIVTSPPPKQVVASGQSIGVIGLSPNTSAPAADVFMLEEDFSGQFTGGYKYYVGTVDFTSLSAWTVANLTKLGRTTSAFGAPVFSASPAANVALWYQDNTMLLGPGLRNGVTDAGPGPGLNVLWVNSGGDIRADQTGQNEILNDRANFVWAGAVPAHISATSASWDVVWVEAVTALGVTHDVMRMNELQCQ
jgi:hypothetical protein